MIYKAYQLLAKLNHLQLAGQDENGLMWLGTKDQWEKAEKEIKDFEEEERDYLWAKFI